MKKVLLTASAAVVLSSCTGGSQSSSGASPAPAPPLKNTTSFPLYSGARVVGTHAFTQNVQVNSTNGVFSSGSGTYTGTQVIASSTAGFTQLSDWVTHLMSAPPPGYSSVERGNNPNERTQAEQYGVDYGAFTHDVNGKTHGVLVIVMDPQRVNRRFGAVLGMIARYRSLPAVMRGPIDDEAKSRIGMTLSQATDPASPIGGALAALDQFQHSNARGIVLIDAAKR